jgi:hypothetical protein
MREGETAVKEKVKSYSLVLCLFTFLFVVIGGGFHLNPGGAFIAAVSGTPLVIYVFNHRFRDRQIQETTSTSDTCTSNVMGVSHVKHRLLR